MKPRASLPLRELRRQILAWACGTAEQNGDPYCLVSSHGNPWNYAASFIGYAEHEGFAYFNRGTDEAVLFLLLVAATLEAADAPS